MDRDLVAVVVLGYLDVPGYATYKPGDVASFEKSVAEALIQQGRARRFQEVLPTTPAPSTETAREQATKPQAAESRAPVASPRPAQTPARHRSTSAVLRPLGRH